jgi:hypothetical protein
MNPLVIMILILGSVVGLASAILLIRDRIEIRQGKRKPIEKMKTSPIEKMRTPIGAWRSRSAAPAILFGIALFVFSYFSYTPARKHEFSGYYGKNYKTEPKLGMATGAALIMGGWLAYRGARRQ